MKTSLQEWAGSRLKMNASAVYTLVAMILREIEDSGHGRDIAKVYVAPSEDWPWSYDWYIAINAVRHDKALDQRIEGIARIWH